MKPIVVVENVQRWSFELEGAEVVTARDYLVGDRYANLQRAAVYNLCRRYGYQSLGYYVSLLASARGHRPLPSVATLQALRLSSVVRIVSDELDGTIQRALAPLRSRRFDLSIYFGRNLARRYDRLAGALFNEFPAPFLRARFTKSEDERWELSAIRPIASGEIPDSHREFVEERAARYFRRPTRPGPKRLHRYDLAVLWRPDDDQAPSDERAIRRFAQAASRVGIRAEVIAPDEAAQIAEYDALFIRETTRVDHHTYRIARRAAREGLVVIDDPDSIVRCSNKVYQAELFRRHGIPTPPTLVVDASGVDRIVDAVGLPAVLKRPDGSFSQGVVKVGSSEELAERLPELFEESDLVVAQGWTPSAFDWRIGMIGGEPFFACKYHMAPGHWQIVGSAREGSRRFGEVEAIPLDAVPRAVLRVARDAGRMIGRGLYGVDVKEVDGEVLVMEVNDNPNVDAGYEDGVVGDELYLTVMRHFVGALEARGRDATRDAGSARSGSEAVPDGA